MKKQKKNVKKVQKKKYSKPELLKVPTDLEKLIKNTTSCGGGCGYDSITK